MKHSAEQQLVAALTSAAEPEDMRRQYMTVEQILADLLGGQRHALSGGGRRPDILLPGPDDIPIIIELKVLRGQFFQKNFHNRVANLLATAVELRRSFRDEVTLSAVLLLTGSGRDPLSHGYAEPIISMCRRMLRSDDGVGYDSVLIGWADDQMRWYYFAASPASGIGKVDLIQPQSTTDAFNLIRGQKSTTQPHSTDDSDSRIQRLLLVADEWKSGHGGLSTINRELAIALAKAGVEAAVMVPHASDEDMRSASDVDVTLVTPARVPGLSDREALLLRPVFADQGWKPDVIMGHGRLLGPYAAAQQQQFFPQALRVHFVHTDAEQLEAAKEVPGGDSHMTSADERRGLERDLARSADLVIGVGPLLTETIRDELIGPGPESKTLCLVPGLRSPFDMAAAHLPVRNQVLVVGRADDFRSKGIDIAAEALLRVVDQWPTSKPHPPILVIRGVPDEAAAVVKAQLDNVFEGRVAYTLRPYSDSETEVIQDLAQARMMLMPSRHEGFGLAAYEAIASGIPVLISSESGLAQFLRNVGIDTSPSSIIPTRNSPMRLATDRWADAIQHLLDNPSSARAQARELRRAVAEVVSWEQSAATLLAELNALS